MASWSVPISRPESVTTCAPNPPTGGRPSIPLQRRDIYVALGGAAGQQPRHWEPRACGNVKPLVDWIWFRCVFMALRIARDLRPALSLEGSTIQRARCARSAAIKQGG